MAGINAQALSRGGEAGAMGAVDARMLVFARSGGAGNRRFDPAGAEATSGAGYPTVPNGLPQ